MKDTLLDNLHMADINPRICGVEACAPGHSFGPAVREYFLLHYVVRGKGIFRRGKREYTLQAGEIFVIRPGEVTYYEADMRDPWEYMWAGFDCAPPFAALLEQDVLRLPGALQNFSRIAGCGDMPAKEWRICAQLYELFAELDAARGPAQGHGGNYVGQAVNYIESNYSQPMRVQDIAAGLGLNRSYFLQALPAADGPFSAGVHRVLPSGKSGAVHDGARHVSGRSGASGGISGCVFLFAHVPAQIRHAARPLCRACQAKAGGIGRARRLCRAVCEEYRTKRLPLSEELP